MSDGTGPAPAIPDIQLFRDAFNASPIGIAVENLDGQPLFANPALCSLLGFSEEEMRSKHCVEFSPPQDSQKDFALFEQLRAGSINHYQLDKRYFRRDGSLVWGRLRISLLIHRPSPLVLAMVEDITEQKRSEETQFRSVAVVESSEELLKTFVKHVPAAVAMLDRDMRYLQVSDRWCEDYSLDSSQILGRSHYDIFPDIPERWRQLHRRALDGEIVQADEDRWDRTEGTTWLRWEIRPWGNKEGLPGGILIFAEDITQRKQMEEMFSSMSEKLLEAQEQERARIARELHDDVNQRLALLAVTLDQIEGNYPDLPSEVRVRINELKKETNTLCNDVQALSHDLHSSQLEYLGVVQGLKSWCMQFGERQGMQIDYRHDVQSEVPEKIGLCLFRILQEAFHNAAKHSGVKRIEVELHEESGEIHLTIRDLGKGFDIEAARQGLGLISMRERVRLLSGTITIASKPSWGTSVHVRLPIEPEKPRSRQRNKEDEWIGPS